ncbi:hypothetical protein V8E36_000765 [Tilletia maclaganii]
MEGGSALACRVTSALEAQFPGRRSQIQELANFFAQPELPSEPAFLLYDPRSPRYTTALIRALLEQIQSEIAQSASTQQQDEAKPELDYVVLPALLVSTARLLFQAILSAIADRGDRGPVPGPSRIGTDDALDTFGTTFARAIRHRTGGDASRYRLCIVIDQAHRIRDLWPEHVTQGLLNPDKLLRDRGVPPGRVSVLMVSHLPWNHYRMPDGAVTVPGPETIFFPPLSKDQTCETLKSNAGPLYLSYSSGRPTLEDDDPVQSRKPRISERDFKSLYALFADVAYVSLRSETADVVEMLMASAAVWHVFIAPVQTGELRPNQVQELLIHGKSAFRDALSQLQSRETSPTEWVAIRTSEAIKASERRIKESKQRADQVGSNVEGLGVRSGEQGVRGEVDELAGEGDSGDEVDVGIGNGRVTKRRRIKLPPLISVPPLPTLSALLLVAAFVACYNPTRLDVNRFMRDESGMPGRKRKKGGGTVKSKAGAGSTESKASLGRQQLLGPKAATLERILAIFQVLLWESDPATLKEAEEEEGRELAMPDIDDQASRLTEVERVSRSAVVFQRVKSLIAQRYLLATSKLDQLTSVSIQVNITYEVAQALAKQVKLKIEDWLNDWKELFQT